MQNQVMQNQIMQNQVVQHHIMQHHESAVFLLSTMTIVMMFDFLGAP